MPSIFELVVDGRLLPGEYRVGRHAHERRLACHRAACSKDEVGPVHERARVDGVLRHDEACEVHRFQRLSLLSVAPCFRTAELRRAWGIGITSAPRKARWLAGCPS